MKFGKMKKTSVIRMTIVGSEKGSEMWSTDGHEDYDDRGDEGADHRQRRRPRLRWT